MCLIDLVGMFFLLTFVLPVSVAVWTMVLWKYVLKTAGLKYKALLNSTKSKGIEVLQVLIGEENE